MLLVLLLMRNPWRNNLALRSRRPNGNHRCRGKNGWWSHRSHDVRGRMLWRTMRLVRIRIQPFHYPLFPLFLLLVNNQPTNNVRLSTHIRNVHPCTACRRRRWQGGPRLGPISGMLVFVYHPMMTDSVVRVSPRSRVHIGCGPVC